MVELYRPHMEDLWFRETMLSDGQTMSYNHAYGGTIPFPKEQWARWYDAWIINPDNKRFYRYVKENDAFLGEAAYHFEEEREMFIADVMIYAPYRQKGYGREALLLLCKNAKDNGVQVIFDEIAIDNPSISLFMKCGFQEVLRTNESVLVKKDL